MAPIDASTIAGIWDAAIATPIGKQLVRFTISVDAIGALSGVATAKHGSVDMRNLKLEGDRFTWSQTVTKPIRLNLELDIVVTGEALEGTARAGALPRSKVSGRRATA